MNRFRERIQFHYQQMKLKDKLRGLYLILTVAYLIIIGIAVNELISNSINQYLYVTSRTKIEGVGENLNASFQSINNMSLLILNDSDVLQYLRTGDIRLSTDAISNTKSISAAFSNVYSIFIIRDDLQYISTGRDITELDPDVLRSREWQQAVDERRGGFIVKLEGAGMFAMNTGADIVSFMRRIYDRDTQQALGYLVVNMPTSIFNDATERFLDDVSAFRVLDHQIRSIGGAYVEPAFVNLMKFDSHSIQRIDRHGFGMLVTTTIMDASNSIRIGIMEDISYLEMLRVQMNILWVGFFFITIVGLAVLTTFITRTVTKPIERLCHSMEEVKKGRLKRVTMRLPQDEIGILKDTYNRMLIETNHLIDDLVEQEKNMKNLELEILYEQVKPHFLYNTLDTICYLVFEKPQIEVYDAVQTLSHFYRKSLSKGKMVITLQDELAIIKDYLTLQRLRYGEIFLDEYDIQVDLSVIHVPKLILQPLVENCIYHGIRPKGEQGTIQIRITDEGDFVLIQIRDDGVGMTEEEIRVLLYQDTGRSFGFKGTIERLKLHYHKDHVCTVESVKGEFFQVSLMIPNA